MNSPLLIYTTFETSHDAEKMAEILLNDKLVACAQISPMESMYWWKGRVEKASEYRLSLKTFNDFYPQIKKIIMKNHPYDVPEIAAVKISQISDSYLEWMRQEIDHD